MFLADYHVHTNASPDSGAPLEKVVAKGISLGLKELAITDHLDFDYPIDGPSILPEPNPDEYINHILEMRESNINSIYILLGIEMGLQPQIKEQVDTFLLDKPFDFVIGSTHCVDYQDLYQGSFFTDKDRKLAYRQYFEDVYNSIKLHDGFDVYGHIDYINRYGGHSDQSLLFKDFQDCYTEIFKLLISHDKGIEINTSGYRYHLSTTHPQKEAINLYKQLGGEIVTVGSDAHAPRDICDSFELAYSHLREAGFKAITTFRKRKPIWVDLPSD